MLRILVSILSFLGLYTAVLAQVEPAVTMELQSDQGVYITGEDIWINGFLSGSAPMPKYIQVQLLDRKGRARAEVKLLNTNGSFSGFLEVPGNLVSDYYFLDSYVKGQASSVEMRPVMIINPRYPPATCSLGNTTANPLILPKPQLVITTDKPVYAKRDPVKIDFNGLATGTNISLYVSRKDMLSDFVDSFSYQYKMLSVHSARGERETEGHLVNIKVMAVAGNAPLKGVRVFAAVIGDQAKLSFGISGDKGQVTFILPLVYGESRIVFSVDEKSEQQCRIEMEDESEVHPAIDFPCLQLTENMRAAIEDRILNSKAAKGFYGDALKRYTIQDADTTDFYGKPDAHYMLDDYTRFPEMKDILLEYVPEARVRNEGDVKPVIQILNAPTKGYFSTSGLVLLDGIPLQDTKQLLSLNPLLLKSIDLVTRKYFLGELQFNGIIQYKSYKSDLAGFALSPRDVIYPFNGVQIPSSPNFADHSNGADEHLPNLRNLLYRELNIAVPENGRKTISFFTADAAAEYKVVVKGKDKNGNAVYGETSFIVQ
ncbi:hypothetical protein [Flavihumibacter profundi]|uniref:hypothetical protein n=1 Tax=Flavihumibacter profundi TaxID=2716883 RepID=UPI001CC63063|nr:hypothetical protein [Flavihumibacter profundi]MBZ5858706.1 hypothetical protein [Flavihumibacter profundi]